MNILQTLRGVFGSDKGDKSVLKGIRKESGQDLILNKRLDDNKIRNIWYNTEKEYKLAASIIICGIRAMRDYVGIPQAKFKSASSTLKVIQKEINRIARQVHTLAFLHGNIFVWSTWNHAKQKVDHIFYDNNSMINPVYDIDTKELLQCSFRHEFQFFDRMGEQRSCIRTRTFTETHIFTKYEGQIPEGRSSTETVEHNLGVLPVVLHTYNRLPDEPSGHGIVEAAEPYLASLSEIILNRIIEDKRSSRKKLNITAKDPEIWLENTKKVNGISFDDQVDIAALDIIFNPLEDGGNSGKAEYLVHGQSATDSLMIAKWLQDSIYEVMSIPEFIFPEKLGASFASVTAQVPNWIHHIEEVRESLIENWEKQLLVDCLVYSQATLSKTPKEIDVLWKRLDLETPELKSKIVNTMLNSASVAKTNSLMTPEEIREYLQEYLNTLGDFDSLDSKYQEMMDFVEQKAQEGAVNAEN